MFGSGTDRWWHTGKRPQCEIRHLVELLFAIARLRTDAAKPFDRPERRSMHLLGIQHSFVTGVSLYPEVHLQIRNNEL